MAIINGAFPEHHVPMLQIGVSDKDQRTVVYSLENPHPLYGKDPNIINELGHTIYPKMVYPKGKTEPGQVVRNAKEEAEVMGKPHEEVKIENTHNAETLVERLTRELEEAKAKLALHDEKEVEAKGEHPWS